LKGLVTRLGTRTIGLTSLVKSPRGLRVSIGLRGLALMGSASWHRFGFGKSWASTHWVLGYRVEFKGFLLGLIAT
jgi:hypothetical protein